MSLLQSGELSESSTQAVDLQTEYQTIRDRSLSLADPLTEADMCIQSMTDASPIRWHLAHTTWFFETFILRQYSKDYQPIDPLYNYLFNSYYNGIGKQFPRAKRGSQTRPSIAEILAYREHVDHAMAQLMATANDELKFLIVLGLNHEQQHQELMLTDIKHAFLQNPAYPAYRKSENALTEGFDESLEWLEIPEGVYQVGAAGSAFCYDNEKPRHKCYIQPVAVASRLITNAEYLAFVEAGGYSEPQLWLADGWDWLQKEGRTRPEYWVVRNGKWCEFTLAGLKPLNSQAPVTHVNFYEANAYAAWVGLRLPTEFEWEVAAQLYAPGTPDGNFFENGIMHPQPQSQAQQHQFWGDVWEWTASDYGAYPGFTPFSGNAGEYNGKFMCNQYVLRGGSCVTPVSHIRKTYRNFFYPHQNWQFTGIRLIKDTQ